MQNDLVIRPAPLPAPRVSAPIPDTPVAAPVPASAPAATGNALPNPTMRLDLALGLVIIEFHNNSGAVTTSIPNAKQMDAYRTARDLDVATQTNRGVYLSATRKV